MKKQYIKPTIEFEEVENEEFICVSKIISNDEKTHISSDIPKDETEWDYAQ